MYDEEQLRVDILKTSHRIWKNGWVANHDGNLTVKLADQRLLATPTAVSKGDVQPEWLIVVDHEDNVVQGTRRAFSELKLHRAAYAARPDIGCVIHAHPPTVTGFAVAGVDIGHPFLAEAIVSLGKTIPTIPFMLPNDPQLPGAIASALANADVVVLANHGALSVGGSLEQAYLRMELLEHLAKIALVSQQLGGHRPLPKDVVDKLSQRSRPQSMPDHRPASSLVQSSSPLGHRSLPNASGRPDVESLVADALNKLKKC